MTADHWENRNVKSDRVRLRFTALLFWTVRRHRFRTRREALSWDYTKGRGGNKYEWDVTFHAPLVGFPYRF